MLQVHGTVTRFLILISILFILSLTSAQAAPLSIAENPLFLQQSAAPLTMLAMSRDHRLFYEAYNDASD